LKEQESEEPRKQGSAANRSYFTALSKSAKEQSVECMHQEQANTEVLQQQIMTGCTTRWQKRVTGLDKCLWHLQRRHNVGDLSAIDYITGVSHSPQPQGMPLTDV